MTGPACGNNPHHKLTDGDRQAVADFKAYLAARAALRDRIAAALYERERPRGEPAWPDARPADREVFEAMADAVLPAVLPAPVDQPVSRDTAEAVLAAVETALGDTLVPSARAEALAGIAAVLPATTNHDTDTAPAATCSAQYHGPGEDRARLCIRAAQHQRTAHTDEHGFHWSDTVAMYPVADGTFRIGTDVRAELRRVADETAATETQAHEPLRQWRVEILDGDEWMPASGLRRDRSQAAEQLRMSSEQRPLWKDGTQVQRRLVRETTTYTVEAGPAANCLCGVLRTGPGRHLPECPNGTAAGARQDGAQQ